jgi:branched-chain amino acid transport system substrate-binding protein
VGALAIATTTGLIAWGGAAGAARSNTNAKDIVVGLANNEGQAISIPEFRYGALAAVKYINATGGIHGHKLKVDTCIDDGSPEGSINCANKFVAAHAVVYFAGIDTGADSAIPIISAANIPYVSEFPWGSVQRSSPDSFGLGAGDTAFFIAPLHALKQAGVKSFAQFYYDIPSSQALLPIVHAIATSLGLTVTQISVSATNPDWTSAVAAAQAAGDQSMWGILQEGDCTNLVQTARSAGFKGPIAVGSCSAYINALGNKAANTLTTWPYYFPQLYKVAPKSIQRQIKIYEKYMDASGYKKDLNGYATASFASMVELSEVMKSIPGTVTGADLLAALKTADVPGFMGPTVDCAAHVFGATEPAGCNAKVLLLKVVATKKGPVRKLESPGYENTASLAG